MQQNTKKYRRTIFSNSICLLFTVKLLIAQAMNITRFQAIKDHYAQIEAVDAMKYVVFNGEAFACNNQGYFGKRYKRIWSFFENTG